MIKRSAAIVGVVLALGATAAVAIAIWPERAGEGGSTSTGQPPVGSAAPQTTRSIVTSSARAKRFRSSRRVSRST